MRPGLGRPVEAGSRPITTSPARGSSTYPRAVTTIDPGQRRSSIDAAGVGRSPRSAGRLSEVNVLGEDPASASMRALGATEVRALAAASVDVLARHVGAAARHAPPAYAKWQGAHWVLHALADLGYPASDPELEPLRDRMVEAWLDPLFYLDVEVATKADTYVTPCRSWTDGTAPTGRSMATPSLPSIRLGLVDDRAVRAWSSACFTGSGPTAADATLRTGTRHARHVVVHGDPLSHAMRRTQAAWSALTGDHEVGTGSGRCRAVDVSLGRSTCSSVDRPAGCIHRDVHEAPLTRCTGTTTCSPASGRWPSSGGSGTPRCADALDLLESKRLPDGGWPAEARYYKSLDDGRPRQ